MRKYLNSAKSTKSTVTEYYTTITKYYTVLSLQITKQSAVYRVQNSANLQQSTQAALYVYKN